MKGDFEAHLSYHRHPGIATSSILPRLEEVLLGGALSGPCTLWVRQAGRTSLVPRTSQVREYCAVCAAEAEAVRAGGDPRGQALPTQ